MKTKNPNGATIANGKDTLTNGFLMSLMALLLMHAVSGGTVEVPMPNDVAATAAQQAVERSADEISSAFQLML